MNEPLGLIAGTGFSDWLQGEREHALSTPYGDMSAPALAARLNGTRVLFLARHGRPHRLAPHRVNYRANLWGLHELGVRHVLAVNVTGSLHRKWPGGTLVVADQIIDYTHGRAHTFCDTRGGAGNTMHSLGHIDFTRPYDEPLRQRLLQAGRDTGIELVDGGVYAATNGPRLETAAEIRRIRRDGGDLVGMTGMPEASLARELGMRYASLCLVSNLAAGLDPEPVDIEVIMTTIRACSIKVKSLLSAL